MAEREILPTTGLTFDDIRDTLGYPMRNSLGGLVLHPQVNMFSYNKPTRLNAVFSDDWQKAGDGSCSISIPVWNGIDNIGNLLWEYLRPEGEGKGSPLRGGDFRGYYHKAVATVTSGYTATIEYDYHVRQRPNLKLTFSLPPVSSEYNLQPRHITYESRLLSQYYWGVRIASPQTDVSYWYLAGTLQSDGITAHYNLENGGTEITILFTAEMIDLLGENATASFFLANMGSASGGFTQAQIASARKVPVYAGYDPGRQVTFLNPVPMVLTRSSEGIAVGENPWQVPYTATSATVSVWATAPVKVNITDAGGFVQGHNVPPEGLQPNENGVINLILNLTPNTTAQIRNATLQLYTGDGYSLAPASQRLTLTVRQAAAPEVLTLSQQSITGPAAGGQLQDVIRVSVPSGSTATWYVSGIRDVPEQIPGGENLDWIIVNNVTDGTTLEPGSTQEVSGSKDIRITLPYSNTTGAERTGYVLFNFRGNYTVLTVTQRGN